MIKRILALLITLCMVIGMLPMAVSAEEEIIFTVDDGCFRQLTGTWASSGLKGPDDASSVYNGTVATAEWRPDLPFGGKFKLFYYNIAHERNAKNTVLEIGDKNGVTNMETPLAGVESGWIELGDFEFTAGGEGYVKVTAPAESQGFVRPSAIKFVVMEKGQGASGLGLVPATGQEPDAGSYGTRTLAKKDVMLPEPKADAVKVYVALGSDGDGSEANPVGSIADAQAKVREIIKGGYPAGGIVVYIKGGTYSIDDTLTFTAADSGTEECPVIWQACEGEEVKITAGKVIANDTLKKVEDRAILDRIPTAGQGNVYVADLAESGIASVEKMDLNSSVPYSLVIGGKSAVLSRWPNVGYGRTDNLIDSSSRGDSGPRKKGFTYEIADPRPLRWTQAEDIWLNGYWMTPYTINYARMASLNTDGMKFSGKDWNSLGSYGNARYFVQNLLEEIDTEGEWFVDNGENKLYLYPYAGWENAEIMFAPKNFDLITMKDASNVILRELNLECAGGTGVVFSAESKGCAMIGGSIKNVSGNGAKIEGNNNYVRDCDISFVGAVGISLNGGNNQKLISCGNYAENNEIHDTGLGGGSKQGMSISGCGTRASNNHIYNTPTHGINGGGMEIIIENNIIERTNMEMGDTGGLYFLNYGMGYGTKIRNNMVKDSVGMVAQTMTGEGALGIYLDDMTCGVEVTGNIIYNAQEPGIFGHGGRHLVFDNNLLINCENPITLHKTGIEKNLVLDGAAGTNIKSYSNDIIRAKYPHALETLTDQFGEPKYNKVTNNITYNSGEFAYANGVSNNGVDEGNIQFEGMPKANLNDFYDLDYTEIKAKNPNFKELDIANMGTYTGGARTETESIVYNNKVVDFNLTYPANGEQNVDPAITFEWENKGGIRNYTVYVSKDENFADLTSRKGVSGKESTFEADLDYGTTYYWRVAAATLLDYPTGWNANGVCSFTTLSAEDKLTAELKSCQHILDVTEDSKVKAGAKDELKAVVEKAQASLASADGMPEAIKELVAAKEAFFGKIIANKDDMTTVIYDDYTLDTIGERPLGWFMRSYSPLNTTIQKDPYDATNQVVCMKDEHKNYDYGMRYFDPQDKYVEFGTSVMAAQTNAPFTINLMKAGVYPVESGAANNGAAMITFDKDGVLYADKQKQFAIGTYEANRWYDIKAEVDLTTATYNVYVDGALVASNVPFAMKDVKKVNQIVYFTDDATGAAGTPQGIFYVDNTIVKVPTSQGKNQYLMSLKVNGETVSGFEPAKGFYIVDVPASDLANANIEYTAGKNAEVKVWDINGGKCVTVISADKISACTYVIKGK